MESSLYISTVCVQGPRELPAVIERLVKLGIRNIELSAPHPHLPEAELIKLLKAWQPSADFVLHNYFPCPKDDFVLNIASPSSDTRNRCADLVQSAFSVANAVGLPVYGVHAGYLADADATPAGKFVFHQDRVDSPASCRARAAAFVNDMLSAQTPPAGGLLLENLFPSETGENFSLACTPDDIAALFAEVDDPRISLLLDLSHFELTCSIFGLPHDQTLDDLLERLGSRIGGIHLSANDGQRDAHLALAKDGWPLRALRRVCQTAPASILTLESRRLGDDEILRQRDMILSAAL